MDDSAKTVPSEPPGNSSSTNSDSSDDDFQMPCHSKSKKTYSCDICPYQSENISNFKKHKNTHEKPRPLKTKYSCSPCKYTTSKSSSLSKHNNSKKHKQLIGLDVPLEGRFACPEHRCSFTASRLELLQLHLQNQHETSIEKDELTFESYEAFKIWKNELQSKECVKFIKTTGRKGNSLTYYCHRSGNFVAKGNNVREMKKRGSVKCGTVCLSRIIIRFEDPGCKVQYWKTHFGHTIDPGRVGITSPQKRELAACLKEGVPKLKILQNMQTSHIDVITPMSLLTNQDLTNIAKKYGVGSDIILHKNDAESIHLKYLQLKQSGDQSIFFYKPYGEISQDYPSLNKEEFVLAYMNNGQEHMLKTQGKEIICIDSTHGTNAYNFEMTTIMTIDDEFQGFPVAFFFHSSKTQETYTNFIRALKERVGNIETSVFMSDDEPAFYNAWKAVMGCANKKLLCSWHVLRNWSKKLNTIDNENNKKFSAKLHVVLCELNILDFEMGYKQILQEIQENPLTDKLFSYFTNYWNRKEEWAYCYRNHAGINTNMSLERMHMEIKTKYLNRKKVKRLDVGFNGVLEYLKQRQYDRVVCDYRGKVSTKDHLLRAAHKRSLEGNFEFISHLSNDTFIVRSFTDTNNFYTIERYVSNCSCDTRCVKCSQCIHSFRCTCIESSIRSNMCKHIHLVCQFIQQNVDQPEVSDDDFNNDLVINTTDFSERRQEEIQSHLLDLQSGRIIASESYTRESAKAIFEQVNGIASDPDDYKVIQDCLLQAMEKINARKSAIESFPMSTQARNQPGNTNAPKQPRYFPKKKKKLSKQYEKSQHRAEIMRQLLPLRLHSSSTEAVADDVTIFTADELPVGSEIEVDV